MTPNNTHHPTAAEGFAIVNTPKRRLGCLPWLHRLSQRLRKFIYDVRRAHDRTAPTKCTYFSFLLASDFACRIYDLGPLKPFCCKNFEQFQASGCVVAAAHISNWRPPGHREVV